MIGLLLASALAAPPAQAPAADATLPPPFSAEQIRAGMPLGSVIEWCPRLQGETSSADRWEVVAADDATVTLRMTTTRVGDDEVVADTTKVFAFAELVTHAVFPADRAERTSVPLTTKVGSGPGWVYTVRGDQGTQRFEFLTAAPGAPVRVVTLVDGLPQGDPMEQCARRTGP
jgi:hypothetical protein